MRDENQNKNEPNDGSHSSSGYQGSHNYNGSHSSQGYHSVHFKRDAPGGPPTPQPTTMPNKQELAFAAGTADILSKSFIKASIFI